MSRIHCAILVGALVAAVALPWRASAVHSVEGMKVMANSTHAANARKIVEENTEDILLAFGLASDSISNNSYFLYYHSSVSRKKTAHPVCASVAKIDSMCGVPITAPVTGAIKSNSKMSIASSRMLRIHPHIVGDACMALGSSSGGASAGNSKSSTAAALLMSWHDEQENMYVSVCPKNDDMCANFMVLPVPDDARVPQPKRHLLDCPCPSCYCCCADATYNIGCVDCYPPKSCFPAEATVEVEGRGPVPMRRVEYGDKVKAVVRVTGEVVYREVYLFGHRERSLAQRYVRVSAEGGAMLSLSPQHFLPVCPPAGSSASCDAASMVYKHAADVAPGDRILVHAAGSYTLAAVTNVEDVTEAGAYNPYIRGADLIVDGVVASPHSNWFLDAHVPAHMLRHLPAVYEAVLAPVYVLFRALVPFTGPAFARWVYEDLHLVEAACAAPLSYAAVLLAIAAAPASLVAVAWRAASRATGARLTRATA